MTGCELGKVSVQQQQQRQPKEPHNRINIIAAAKDTNHYRMSAEMEDMGQTEETFETEVRRKVTRTAFKIEEVSGEMAITLKCKLVISSYLEMIIIV